MRGTGDLRLVASGHRHPTTVLHTEDLEKVLPNVEPGWIGTRLGMHSRRVALPHERMTDHGVDALRDALGRAAWTDTDVELVVCGTSFGEDLIPARASVIAEAVNPPAIAFDVNAACSSFVYALAVADGMLRPETPWRRAAVCVVERPTASADYRDSHSSAFFGDSAAAFLVERGGEGPGFVVESLSLMNDGNGSEAVRAPRSGHFHHDSKAAYHHVLSMGEKVVAEALDDAGVRLDQVHAFVGHQANEQVLRALGARVGLPWERQWHNFEWAGNQAAAGVATTLSDAWNDDDRALADGDLVVLGTVGSGYAAGAAVLRWRG